MPPSLSNADPQQYSNSAQQQAYANFNQGLQQYPNAPGNAIAAQPTPYPPNMLPPYTNPAQQQVPYPASIPNPQLQYAGGAVPAQSAPFHIPQQRNVPHALSQQPMSQALANRPNNASSYGGGDVVYTGPSDMPKPAFGFSCDQGMRSENEDRLFCHPRLINGSARQPLNSST